jgi:hypothetical protein
MKSRHALLSIGPFLALAGQGAAKLQSSENRHRNSQCRKFADCRLGTGSRQVPLRWMARAYGTCRLSWPICFKLRESYVTFTRRPKAAGEGVNE